MSLLVIALCAALSSPREQQQEEAFFEEEQEPAFELRTVWDFRFVRTDVTRSWLDGELGKTRYGGDGAMRQNLFRIAQASVVWNTRPHRTLTTHVHVNFDLEPENPEGRYGWDRIRLIEAFADWRKSIAEPLELRVKGGLFFPPISLENVGEAWSTFYTVTPSAINAWVGEEVRSTGVELGLANVGLSNELTAKAAVFWNNDPTGSLLAYRGFTIHDRQTGWRDRVPLPPIPSIESGLFAQQAPFVEPLVEIDDRPGYYGALSWENYRFFQLNGIYFDNRGIPDSFDGEQYAWDTRFLHVGTVLFLPGEAELLAQFMDGDTYMGLSGPTAPKVTGDFRSWYALLSVPFGRHRVSFRYEEFRFRDGDIFREPDASDEDGSAWTLAYLFRIAGQHRIAFEILQIDSERPARISIGLPVEAKELQMQLSLRLQF